VSDVDIHIASLFLKIFFIGLFFELSLKAKQLLKLKKEDKPAITADELDKYMRLVNSEVKKATQNFIGEKPYSFLYNYEKREPQPLDIDGFLNEFNSSGPADVLWQREDKD